ncbi:glyoxalase bleomycin resistance protein dioxygenase [Fusarium avenaceum]|nr:glyoxalase bleomycin resistance protein dioxygenase [Fusarium avenaceum]
MAAIQENCQSSSTTNTESNSVEEPVLPKDSVTAVTPLKELKPLSPAATEPALVPELLVVDTSKSIAFWCGLCGFEIEYQRADEGFAYISRGTAHVMLEQRGIGRNWITAPLDQPFGRGINFQVSVSNLEPILLSLSEADYPLFMPLETKWYHVSSIEEAGVQQFLVADPDGYLIRFQASIGRRAIT